MLQLYATELVIFCDGYISCISIHLESASRYQEPIHWLEGSSVAIVDPPRKGLHPSVINALQRVGLSERKAYKAKRYEKCHSHSVLSCFYFYLFDKYVHLAFVNCGNFIGNGIYF
jgi:hypothetical protein